MKNFFITVLLLFFLVPTMLGIFGCRNECVEPRKPNLAPVIEDQTLNIDENSGTGSSAGVVVASDPNDQELTYSVLTQSPFEAFEINTSSGELTVIRDVTLSYEENEIFSLLIKVSDGELADSANVTVEINDLLENFELVLKLGREHGKDAILHSLLSDDNFGTHPQINAHAWTSGGNPQIMRGLIQFDLSGISESAVIQQANLSLFHLVAWNNSGHSQLSGSNESVIQNVIEPWEEETVTWNTQPAVTSDNEVTLQASTLVDQNYTGIDVTNLIVDENQKLRDNYGFMLSLKTETYYRSMVFASSDAENEELHPELVIQYLD